MYKKSMEWMSSWVQPAVRTRGRAVMWSAALSLLTALTFAPHIANATVTDNTSLADPPGLFYGTGNSNTNFTVDDENGVELGLSAITRFVGPIVPTGDVYTAPDGSTTVPGKTGTTWGVDFSINLESSGLNLSGVTAQLTLTDSHTGSSGVGANPLLIPDNSIFGTTAAQNSEALSFHSIAVALDDPGFDAYVAATYTFTLNLFNAAGDLIASDTIVVDTVPEPGSLSLLFGGLLSLVAFGFLRRRGESSRVVAG